MYCLNTAFTLVAILGALGLSKAQDPNIVPNDVVVRRYLQDAVLQCVVADLESYQPMEWYRDEERIVNDPVKYEMSAKNGTLTVFSIRPDDVGEYQCVVNLHSGRSFNKTVNMFGIPFVTEFDKSKNLVQGDPLVQSCHVEGHPRPTVQWMKDDEPIDTSDPRITLIPNDDNVENATLRIENLDFDDRGDYICTATNEYSTSNSTILVRVKDKLAALWPFLGICAEVAILVLIIFIYERKRAKKMEELEAKEEADNLTNSHSHKGADDVRQRK